VSVSEARSLGAPRDWLRIAEDVVAEEGFNVNRRGVVFNASGLRYDVASNTYIYNWKTDSTWKGQCRTLVLAFSDGDVLKANFKFN
jgi:hypothetical protein